MSRLWQLWQTTAARLRARPVLIEAGTERMWTAVDLTGAAVDRAGQLPANLRGRVVAFCLPNGTEWFARFLAIQQRGAVAIALDPSLLPEAQEYAARVLGAQFLWRDEELRRLSQAAPAFRNVCCIKATSGTTGKPKAVSCAADHLTADGRQILRTMRIGSTDRNLGTVPCGHSYGLGNLVMPLLLQGTAAVCAATCFPREILRLIEQYRVTVFPTVPAVLRGLAQMTDAQTPATLRLVISAGGPLSAEIAREFHGRYGLQIHNFYGSTETGGICYDRTGHATLTGRGIGKPLSGVTVRVRRDGRVWVRSAAVATPRRQVTLADRGMWNPAGELQLIGRVDSVANLGGKKVAPAEVEYALRRLTGVTDAWVTVLQDVRGNDYLAAAVETQLDRAALEHALVRSLPAWQLPKRYVFRASFPRTAHGKTNTTALKTLLMAQG